MNRRTLIQGAAAAAVAPVLACSLPAGAQGEATPEATPGTAPQFLSLEGQLVLAGREYEAAGFRPGAAAIRTMVAVYDTVDHARAAFQDPMFFDELKKRLAADNGSLGEVKDASTPKLGDERAAEVATGTRPERDFHVAVFRARKAAAVHLWLALGFLSPLTDLLTLAETAMRFEPIDPKSDAALLALLPKLDEMPPGFTVHDEGVVRP